MSLPLKARVLTRSDGTVDPRAVQQNLEQLAGRYPLLPGEQNFQRAPQARVYNSANISIPTGADTTLTFNSERWDYTPSGVDDQHETDANTSRLTCRVPGLYRITGHVRFDSNATGIRRAMIRYTATGGGTANIDLDTRNASSGAATDLRVSADYRLAAGEYVELRVFQNSGGALNVLASGNHSPEFSFHWVSP